MDEHQSYLHLNPGAWDRHRGLDLVFQANAPTTVASFLQRLGRTGRRAGQRANTTFFCEDPETVLQAIALVELARKGWVESIPPHTRCWPVLVHQLLALTLQLGGSVRSSAGPLSPWCLIFRTSAVRNSMPF